MRSGSASAASREAIWSREAASGSSLFAKRSVPGMKDGEAVQGFAQLSHKINRIIDNEATQARPDARQRAHKPRVAAVPVAEIAQCSDAACRR